MEKVFVFRAYPNSTQKELMAKTFGCVRFVYNYFLSKQIESYDKEKKHISMSEMSRELTTLKKEKEWLKEPDKYALQNAIKNLNHAYLLYFKEMKKPGYVRFSDKKKAWAKRKGKNLSLSDSYMHPRFKKKSEHRNSFRTQNCFGSTQSQPTIDFKNNKIKLPKLGWVKIKDKQAPEGRILNASVIQERSGEYYIYLCCTDIETKPLKKTNRQIGIDLGVDDFCVLSNGDKISIPKSLDDLQKKISKLHKELDRKPSYSSNWEKTRIKLAKTYAKASNQKRDFLQKLTTQLITDYDIICIETLGVNEIIMTAEGPNRVKAHFRKRIANCSWYEFICELQYKARWYGKTIIKNDNYFPSSQICHICGYKNEAIRNTRIREWKCPICGTSHDRDVNAAINILNEGLKKI